ncbi:hypothetical protein AKN87_05445 [Thiopseudomonas alkaliphila]|uniref:DUF485 domain-containing protein n=1 Tax=Thiopseudomonas alkaliphila TaxID=1697053 RepID=UPI00069FD769|nr:DUF485 domain-containing protein [Thiopseudomonas alkaliphila]AKX44604.1 hypothetical protein AKN87_05445 [Thiopseudomonas alkaliphila]AKX47802.1 hypothetical protein AKN94_10865 [Thiopseudomonas alkaliphila]AKX47986.1 hypothetical protein AKN93_00095 [Thiopseudomonas alkaliphila]AKX53122.1 hypothetical protein AKN91_05160 [Thiopseudomonas alkaliphila]
MSNHLYAHIRNNPKFQQLVKTRTRFALSLSLIVWAIFYGFILLVAFKPEVIGLPLGRGHLTLGIAAGLFQFSFFWLLIWWYVRRANGEFDRLNEQIITEAEQECGQ